MIVPGGIKIIEDPCRCKCTYDAFCSFAVNVSGSFDIKVARGWHRQVASSS